MIFRLWGSGGLSDAHGPSALRWAAGGHSLRGRGVTNPGVVGRWAAVWGLGWVRGPDQIRPKCHPYGIP